jgi:4-amino-4-deoxy-L-arabinose transferase-like glycosyltransferase
VFKKKVLLKLLPLLLVVLLASALRLVWLDKIPNAIGGDEMTYLLNSKSLFISGHDVYGQWNIVKDLMFIFPKGETAAELEYILFAPAVGLLGFSLFSAHIVNVILGIIAVIFFYLIVRELVGPKSALYVSLIAAINPWLIYIGRTAYEAIPAMLFYLVSLYLLIKVKGWRIMLVFPFLLLAFYSYIGTKIILVPFTVAVSVFCYLVINKKKYLKQYLILIGVCVVLAGLYFFSLQLNPSTSRMGELLTPGNAGIVNEVNEIRAKSVKTPITNIFTNKYTIFTNTIAVKTLASFAIRYLFIQGDEFFSIWRHGLFYYLDAFFIVLGAVILFARKRAVFVLFSVLMIIGVVPQVFHSSEISDYSLHLTMLFPFLIILSGVGIAYATNLINSKRWQITAEIIILGLYFILMANFLNIYFTWFPLRGYFDLPIRIASDYAKFSEQSGYGVNIYSNRMYDFFKKYVFYTNGLTKNNYQDFKSKMLKEDYRIGKVQILSCDPTVNPAKINKVIIYDDECAPVENPAPAYYVPKLLSDVAISYKIYNDQICKGVGLKPYPSEIQFSDFDMEKMSTAKFCKTFITRF